MDDAKFGHAFNQIENFGALRLKMVFDVFGSFKTAWESAVSELREKIKDVSLFRFILENREKINPEKEWQEIKSAGIQAITINDEIYPKLLKETSVPPALLYYQGDLSGLHSNYSVAIVGTRRATYYGIETAFKLSRELALRNINIVSGLALGIDAQAHRGCLEVGTGKTFAVLGSGLLKIHPKTNLNLSEQIVKQGGAIISEYPPLLCADKWTFPQRNRIIAGLATVTVIVEAPEKSGALITGRFALDANRDIGVVPGEINSIVSKGSNRLLKCGAYPICEAKDILEILGIDGDKNILEEKIFDPDESLILKNIGANSFSEQLLRTTGLDVKIFNQKISMLELRGIIRNINGRFERI